MSNYFNYLLVILISFMCCMCRLFAFSAFTLLVGCQEEHPAGKNQVMRCWCG